MITKAKNKCLNSLRLDLWDKNFSKFKHLKALKNAKSDLISSLKKRFRFKFRIKSKNKNTFFLRKVLNKLAHKEGKQSKNLSFNSKNTRNVFLRTKRKSAYGQTLMEKQKVKNYVPILSKKILSDTFSIHGSNTLNFINKNPYQVINVLNIFDSKYSLLNLSKYGYGLMSDSIFINYDSVISNLNFPKLVCVPGKFFKKSGKPFFNRPEPSHLVHDLRLNKVKVLFSYTKQQGLPFKFNEKKFNQHLLLNKN